MTIAIIELKVEGYRDLFCILSDLLQTTRLAVDELSSVQGVLNIERYIGSLENNRNADSIGRGRTTDILYRKHLNENNTPINLFPLIILQNVRP
jgi:hypothetical protein